MTPVESRNELDRVAFADITFALPAQRFAISCAVTVEETLPVVSEFSIRMIQLCGALNPSELQTFFGFSERETTIVIRSLIDERLVRWEDDGIVLTPYALSKFLDSADGIPRCVRIKEWSGDAVFELLSYWPIGRQTVLAANRVPIELASSNTDKESRTSYWAEKAFQEHFQSVITGRDKIQIYKISEMEPKERLNTPLGCTFLISLDGKAEVTRSLPDKNLEDRPEVVLAISDALASGQRKPNAGMQAIFELFGVWSGSQFDNPAGFSIERYLDLVHVSKRNPFNGDVHPITGAFYLADNRRDLKYRLDLLAKLGARGVSRPGVSLPICWLGADVPFWGRSLAVRSLLRDLRKFGHAVAEGEAESEQNEELPTVRTFVQPGRIPDRHLMRVYSDAIPSAIGMRKQVLDGKIEMLWIPDVLVSVLYHYQVDHAVPVPVGFLSTEPAHLQVARQIFVESVFQDNGLFELKNADKGQGADLTEAFANLRRDMLIAPPADSLQP